MKKQKVFLIFLLILLLAIPVSAEEVTVDADQTQQEEQSSGYSPPKRSSTSNFDFSTINFDNLIEKIEGQGGNLWELAQALTWPMLIGSFVIGAALLLFGAFVGILSSRMGDAVKGAGGMLIFFGILKFALINFAPEIAEGVVTYIEGIFATITN